MSSWVCVCSPRAPGTRAARSSSVPSPQTRPSLSSTNRLHTRAASLIYLVPPLAAVQAWLFFGEALTLPMVIGTIIAVAGVYLTNRKQA